MEGNPISEANGATAVNGVKEYRYFADGEWRPAEGKKLFDVFQPFDRDVYARVADGDNGQRQYPF